MNNTNKWFSIIEIIITISIIALLTVIWISSKKWYDENVSNTKIVSDTKTISNALSEYIQENTSLPMPGWNVNFFWVDTSYMHSYKDPATFWVYGSITEKTIPKKYLDNLPLDPRTNSYYSYWKTKKKNEFEIASVHVIDSTPIAKVIWNYTAENWPYNLIREYNWPNFVYNWSEKNFPYNPDELIMIATDKTGKIYKQWDTIIVPINQTLEIFFADGSVSILWDTLKETRITLNELNFKWKDNLNTLVKLWLEAGKIWTKATKLNTNSEFVVTTNDSGAAVRWTIFWVVKDTSTTQTILIEWEVDVSRKWAWLDWNIVERLKVTKWEQPKTIMIYSYQGLTSSSVTTGVNDLTLSPTFTLSDELRSDDTIMAVNKCNSFRMWIDNICMDDENGMDDDWWKLFAYAPYDKVWDINMYSSWAIQVSSNNILNNTTTLPFICEDIWSMSNSFCKIKDSEIKWIFVNTWTNDFIKYWDDVHQLNLSWDFAIEMNVNVPNDVSSTKHYLINEYNNIELYTQSWFFKFNNNWWTAEQISNISIWFNKITLIKQDWKLKVKIWDTLYNLTHTLTNNVNSIFIWSTYIKTLQINDIIDYVKIYIKN